MGRTYVDTLIQSVTVTVESEALKPGRVTRRGPFTYRHPEQMSAVSARATVAPGRHPTMSASRASASTAAMPTPPRGRKGRRAAVQLSNDACIRVRREFTRLDVGRHGAKHEVRISAVESSAPSEPPRMVAIEDAAGLVYPSNLRCALQVRNV